MHDPMYLILYSRTHGIHTTHEYSTPFLIYQIYCLKILLKYGFVRVRWWSHFRCGSERVQNIIACGDWRCGHGFWHLRISECRADADAERVSIFRRDPVGIGIAACDLRDEIAVNKPLPRGRITSERLRAPSIVEVLEVALHS